MAVWAEAQSAAGYLDDETVNLIFTSPPYALLSEKDYGNVDHRRYADWFLPMAEEFRRVLAMDGSMVLNLGPAYLPGAPVQSLYQERLILRLVDDLGFHLAQRFYWQNPAKLPAPAQWVTVRRIRVKDSVEQIWWLSKSPNPKADNRAVLTPYSAAQIKVLKSGWETQSRPSGHALTGNFAKDNGGSIPGNTIIAPNTGSNDRYLRGCREAGIKPHPARFPAALPEFFIKFLTEEGDVVADFFAGSNTTGEVCERLNRRWISTEKSLEYLRGSMLRFPGCRWLSEEGGENGLV